MGSFFCLFIFPPRTIHSQRYIAHESYLGNWQLDLPEWFSVISFFPFIGGCFFSLWHSPSVLVCGQDRVQKADACLLFLFLDASFPKCCFHLPGCPNSRFFFPQHITPWPPLPRHVHTLWCHGRHWRELEQMPSEWRMCLPRQGSAPLSHSDANIFGILQRRIRPGCVLQPPHTLSPSVQSLGLASCIVCFWNSQSGSSWMLPLSRHAARNWESILRVRSSVPRNPSNNLIASGLYWAPSNKGSVSCKAYKWRGLAPRFLSHKSGASMPTCLLKTEAL